MRAQLEAIIDELKTLRSEGVSSVYLEDHTLDALRARATESRESAVQQPQAIDLPELPAAQPKKRAAKKAATDPAKAQGLPEGTKPIPEPTPFELPKGDKQAKWNWLRDRVLNCPVCNEHRKPDKQIVFGVGNLNANIFFCGEAPGADEETQGEPFVGQAGQLLTKIIKAMGLNREDVYISNILNWRPEHNLPSGNRKPVLAEMRFGLPTLVAQLRIVQPRVIVALGGTAVDGLLGPDPKRRMRQVRGKWHEFEQTPLMITYHPSYLLHNNSPATKREVWEDMLAVMEHLKMPITEKQRGYFT